MPIEINKFINTIISAFWNLISPHANSSFSVISETRTALISGGFSVPAIPENVTFLLISKNTIKSGTMGCADSWFQLRPFSTLNIMQVIAIFCEEFCIGGIECQTVTTSFQFCYIIITFPVFVTRNVMWIKPEVVWTFETLLRPRT